MFSFFKKLFVKQPEIFTGVIGDTVSDTTIPFSEVVASSAKPQWLTKNTSQWRKFPYQYQSSSSACVAYTMAKIATGLYSNIKNTVIKFSPAFYYTRRANKPQEGMAYEDIVNLAKDGALLYDLLPCEGYTEAMINSLVVEQYHKDSADAFAFPSDWVELPLDFDTVAATIEKTGKPIMTWFTFGPNEFFGITTPKVLNNNNPWRHSVTCIDAFTYGGVQYLLIEDSADQQSYYRKLITREFFNKKALIARYPINLKFALGDEIKPKYDGSTVSLQKCLKHYGTFPKNVEETGVFGNITKKAVSEFQKKESLKISGSIDHSTMARLTELYS